MVRDWLKCIMETWETTKPEWISHERPTRFLGMEMYRYENGTWALNQQGYTVDLLRRNLGKDETKWGRRKIPITKDNEGEAPEVESQEKQLEPSKALAQIREAQRIVGELVWLVTRCRPDLMFVLNRMAVLTTRHPERVIDMAPQVWRFLAQSQKEGLLFALKDGGNSDIEVFTDASYGETCQGCVVIKWGGSPVLWKSSRQSIITTSTAAAELLEVMEGATMAEAVRVVAEELHDGKVRCWQ